VNKSFNGAGLKTVTGRFLTTLQCHRLNRVDRQDGAAVGLGFSLP
jgi:hypothetical protein